MTIRVVVADDQPLVRTGLSGVIGTECGLTIVGEAATGREAVDLAVQTRPDVILMDIRMPDMDGIEATAVITGHPATPNTRILILTTFDLDEYVFAALRAGASGFLLKDALPADLVTAIRVIAAGDALLAPSVTRRLIREFTRTPVEAPADVITAAITDREREVLTLIAAGLTNSEIAGRLYVSQATVKTHVGHLLTKLGARDRVQLVLLAFQSGVAAP